VQRSGYLTTRNEWGVPALRKRLARPSIQRRVDRAEECRTDGVPPAFLATAVVLLRKGDDAPIPLDLASISAREWEAHFMQYANDPKTPIREKTQAFERATRAELTGA
jgi:hypothetical protein